MGLTDPASLKSNDAIAGLVIATFVGGALGGFGADWAEKSDKGLDLALEIAGTVGGSFGTVAWDLYEKTADFFSGLSNSRNQQMDE